jgi:hypothetical protein
MFSNLKLSPNYFLLIVSLIFLKSSSSFHIHILPKNQDHKHNQNQNNNFINNSENPNNTEFKPLDNIAKMFLSNIFYGFSISLLFIY